MRSSRAGRSQRPPAPCVEEEATSLAHEVDGLSKLGVKPGVEGICQRGTVDQYPIIASPHSALPASVTPSCLASNPPGLGNFSSDDNSSGPRTPPPQFPEPVIRVADPQDIIMPQHTSNPDWGKARGVWPPHNHHHEPARERFPHPNPQARSRDRDQARDEYDHPTQRAPRESRHEHAPRGHGMDHAGRSVQESSLARSNSARTTNRPLHEAPGNPDPHPRPRAPHHRHHHSLPAQEFKTSESAPGSRGRQIQVALPPAAPPSQPQIRRPDLDTRTLAERLDEKLRLRQELRELSSDSDSSSTRRSRSKSTRTKSITMPSAPDPRKDESRRPRQPHPDSDSDIESPRFRPPRPTSPGRQDPTPRPVTSRGRATTMSAVPQPRLRSAMRDPSKSKAMSSDEASPHKRRHVKFQEQLPHRYGPGALVPAEKAVSPQRIPNMQGLCVGSCPRSMEVAGFNDWYTLDGLNHLDICPSCKDQMLHSRFSEFFMPASPKPAKQEVRCAFSNSWVRLAWTQMIKKQHDSLELLYQMTRPPPGVYPCPGRKVVEQSWHRVVNPETGGYLPNLHACTSCARSIRILMPSHRDTFRESSEIEPAICDFFTTSPRFVTYIDLLDNAAQQRGPSQRPDLHDFIAYARRKSVLKHCRRDRSTMSTWHYMSSLSELTACEDCYDEVIWPLAKARHPIAMSFSTSMRLLPGDEPGRPRAASCQLYSPRMRARFREAVTKDDFHNLKDVVMKRFEAERRYKDRREELAAALERGFDCVGEVRKAIEEWKRWE